MKTVLVLGAGMVAPPLVDYFINCNYTVTLADMDLSKAEFIIDDRHPNKAIKWSTDDPHLLNELVQQHDLVVSILPPQYHIIIAKACLKHNTNMITASYTTEEMSALDEQAKQKDMIIMNEVGEDPGLDHMSIMKLVNEIKSNNGNILSLHSYGSGIPAKPSNPLGYKFSWSPKGVIRAARASAAYLHKGNKISIPSNKVFTHTRNIYLRGLGQFEAYPNRDCTNYPQLYNLNNNISMYRGCLRYPGWSSFINALNQMDMLDDSIKRNFDNKSYNELVQPLLPNNIEQSDLNKLTWLGLLDNTQVSITNGTNADLLIDLMVKKMSYDPGEEDMVIIHSEIEADYDGILKKHTSTMVYSDTGAMPKAVSLPLAITSKLILENKIPQRGVLLPIIPEVYNPVLTELESYGIIFHNKIE